jgi:glycosyltransferase involved in cell wall biosynthesis
MNAPLKILYVLEASGGGVGRHTIDLAKELARRGHAVHLIYSRLRMEEGFSRELATLDRINSHPIDMRRAPHPGDLAALWKIRRYIRKFGPFDVIHGHSSKGGALARLAAIGLPGTRVYTPHALRTMDPLLASISRWLYRAIECTLCHVSDAIILVSDEEKKHALEEGLTPEKLHVVTNGIDPQAQQSRDAARQQLQFKNDHLYIGFIGRFVPQKAPESLIMAFAETARQFEAAHLVMLGDGPLSTTLHQLAERLGMSERIIWINDIPGPALMPALDVFVMPSRYEAFPYVLLEAAAAGLPIIATPVGGTSAVLKDGVNGYLTPPDQPALLAQSLTRLMDDDALRNKMGQASRELVQAFTIGTMTECTLEVYETATSSTA